MKIIYNELYLEDYITSLMTAAQKAENLKSSLGRLYQSADPSVVSQASILIDRVEKVQEHLLIIKETLEDFLEKNFENSLRLKSSVIDEGLLLR